MAEEIEVFNITETSHPETWEILENCNISVYSIISYLIEARVKLRLIEEYLLKVECSEVNFSQVSNAKKSLAAAKNEIDTLEKNLIEFKKRRPTKYDF